MGPAEANRQRRYLNAMGVAVWERRNVVVETPQVAQVSVPAEPVVAEPFEVERPQAQPVIEQAAPEVAEIGLDWPALEAKVAACTACELHQTRTQTVFGVGDRQADWMVIGEAPGADEDRRGEPFVGRAGQLLNEMLFALGFRREQVFIANILKCRPPNNRDPKPEEAACCEGFLMRQIELVRPRVILSVGRISAQNLLKTEQSMARLRGRVYRFGPQGIPLVTTYHPAYLLRSPLEKRKVWEDLLLARSAMEDAG